MPTALITGITGQDGGYLAERLLADGWVVHGAVRGGEQRPAHLPTAVTLTEVDLLDAASVAALLEAADPDEIYNLASVSSVARSWEQPVETAQVNGLAVAILLDRVWERHAGGRQTRFLQASSAEIFAGTPTSPQNEDTPLAPRSPYGAAKAFAHQLVQVYRSRGLFAVNVILYNHESPRRPATFVTRKITQFAARLAAGEVIEPLRLGNLDSRRDWGWAPEYVAGMVLALRHDNANDYVLATGQSHSVGEFAALALSQVGIADAEKWIRSDEAFIRPTDAAELIGDAARARRTLGWTPAYDLAATVAGMLAVDRAEV